MGTSPLIRLKNELTGIYMVETLILSRSIITGINAIIMNTFTILEECYIELIILKRSDFFSLKFILVNRWICSHLLKKNLFFMQCLKISCIIKRIKCKTFNCSVNTLTYFIIQELFWDFFLSTYYVYSLLYHMCGVCETQVEADLGLLQHLRWSSLW